MLSLIAVNLRSMFLRKGATALTIVVVGLVVALFALVTSLAVGLTETLRATGDERHLLVLRAAARSELESWVDSSSFAIISTLPGIDRDSSGRPVVVGEAFTVINSSRRGGGSANVIVRGASADSFRLRPEVRVVEGRLFAPNVAELIVSRAISQRFDGLGLGETVRLRGRDFLVVGIFDAGRTAWDSEVWGDFETLSQTYGRLGGYSSVLMRVSDPASRKRIADQIASDRRLNFKVVDQKAYFEEQTSSAGALKVLAFVLTIVLSVGACFAAANTMYAAVAQRSREIGTLRALGFSRASIVVAFVVESVCLSSLAGVSGVVAAGLGLALFGTLSGYSGTLNQATFAEVAFAFRLTPGIAAAGIALAALMGLVGGILPARHAARVPITQALRQI